MSPPASLEPASKLFVDESTPLIAAAEAGPTAQAAKDPISVGTDVASHEDEEEDEDKPLPRIQILLLCYARLVEPIAFFSIFPFVNQMIFETGGIDEGDVGFYSGLIESLFSITQMILMISWGRAADRLGRKPVLVFCLLGCGVGTALFGLSKTVWQMALCRCFAGLFAGMLITIRAMFSEVSTRKTQARAFSFFAFSGNLGIFLGPFIGGGLSNPATQYPSVFGQSAFLKEYPYALPTFVSGLFAASAAIICAIFLEETLSPKDARASAAPPMTTRELLKAPGVGIVLYIYAHVMLLAFGYTAVAPVFWFTEPKLGGYGFRPIEISIILGINGIAQAVYSLLLFPPLQRRIGTGGVLRACSIVWPIFFFVGPLCVVFRLQHADSIFWTILSINTLVGPGVSMAFTAVQLALNDIAPSHQTLGTLNALALTSVSGLRAVAPALFTSLFATGIRKHLLGGYMVWLILIILALVLTVVVRWLPEKAEGRTKSTPHDED